MSLHTLLHITGFPIALRVKVKVPLGPAWPDPQPSYQALFLTLSISAPAILTFLFKCLRVSTIPKATEPLHRLSPQPAWHIIHFLIHPFYLFNIFLQLSA